MEDVHFRCGHTVEVRLPKDEKARTSMRTQMESRLCRTCDYEAKVEAALIRGEQVGLVPLRGTPRQVAYASLLRCTQVDLFLQEIEGLQWANEDRWERLYRHLLSIVNALPASWWLEHHELSSLQSLLGDGWKKEN